MERGHLARNIGYLEQMARDMLREPGTSWVRRPQPSRSSSLSSSVDAPTGVDDDDDDDDDKVGPAVVDSVRYPSSRSIAMRDWAVPGKETVLMRFIPSFWVTVLAMGMLLSLNKESPHREISMVCLRTFFLFSFSSIPPPIFFLLLSFFFLSNLVSPSMYTFQD